MIERWPCRGRDPGVDSVEAHAMGREDEEGTSPPRAGLLWGSRSRPSRGRPPTLSLDRIVTAAIAIADAEGLAALSMQRLATELGAGTMSLYRYVSGKAELAALMLDTVIGEPPDYAEAGDWRAGLEQWARENYAIFQRHPWTLPLVTDERVMGPNETSHLEAALRTISGCGLSARDMLDTALLVNGFVRGTAQYSIRATPGAPDKIRRNIGEATAETIEEYDRKDRYPTLVAAMAAAGEDAADAGEQTSFEFGLQRILDGLERYAGPHAR
jgi:AcrR family transcriptional regulator